jgi:hypothetical protein
MQSKIHSFGSEEILVVCLSCLPTVYLSSNCSPTRNCRRRNKLMGLFDTGQMTQNQRLPKTSCSRFCATLSLMMMWTRSPQPSPFF